MDRVMLQTQITQYFLYDNAYSKEKDTNSYLSPNDFLSSTCVRTETDVKQRAWLRRRVCNPAECQVMFMC